MTNDKRVPLYPNSLWLKESESTHMPAHSGEDTAEVTITGAGAAGITAAYYLAKAGTKVVLLEAGRVLEGTTGNTTAKISSQHGMVYDELIQNHGREKTSQYFEANEQAISDMRKRVTELGIDCDWEERDAFIYTKSEEQKKVMEQEAEAYRLLNVNGGDALKEHDLPYAVERALVIRDQAQFQPVHYYRALLEEVVRLGGRVYENTRAADVNKSNGKVVVNTNNDSMITSDYLLVATHFPFNDGMGKYYSRLHVERSYIIGAKVQTMPKHMYISVDSPSRSLRTAKDENGEDLLLIGGEGHTSGKNEMNTFERYEALRAFGEEYFGLETVPYRWSAQDMITLDKMPYVGPMTSGEEQIFTATGFMKWGISNSEAAGKMLADYVLGNENVYKEAFDPTRSELKKKNIQSFAAENMDVGKEMVKGKSNRGDKEKTLENDEGALINTEDGKAGAYRDETGRLYVVDTTCTHMGCDLSWNNAERSWDCPCHGSRFSYDGEVIEGPAVKPLKRKKDLE